MVSCMYELGSEGHDRLTGYLNTIGSCLRDKRKRASFAMYAYGILGEGERKSVEPIAARASGDPLLVRAYTERLLHFLGESNWDDRVLSARVRERGLEIREPRACAPVRARRR